MEWKLNYLIIFSLSSCPFISTSAWDTAIADEAYRQQLEALSIQQVLNHIFFLLLWIFTDEKV